MFVCHCFWLTCSLAHSQHQLESWQRFQRTLGAGVALLLFVLVKLFAISYK